MARRTSPESHASALKVLDLALERPKGIALTFSSRKKAEAFRFRLYAARTALRDQSRRVLQPEVPGWGKSPYDELVLTITTREDKWILLLTKGISAVGLEGITDIVSGEGLEVG